MHDVETFKKRSKAFRAWKKRMAFTHKKASVALGVSFNTVANFYRGKRTEHGDYVVIPHTVMLACAAIEANIEPIK